MRPKYILLTVEHPYRHDCSISTALSAGTDMLWVRPCFQSSLLFYQGNVSCNRIWCSLNIPSQEELEPYEKLLSPIAKRSHRISSLSHHYSTRQSCSLLQSQDSDDKERMEAGSKQKDEGEGAEGGDPAVRTARWESCNGRLREKGDTIKLPSVCSSYIMELSSA